MDELIAEFVPHDLLLASQVAMRPAVFASEFHDQPSVTALLPPSSARFTLLTVIIMPRPSPRNVRERRPLAHMDQITFKPPLMLSGNTVVTFRDAVAFTVAHRARRPVMQESVLGWLRRADMGIEQRDAAIVFRGWVVAEELIDKIG
jgi:hypothetical protein